MARVRYFAAAEELAGIGEEHRSETTLGALRAAVVRDHPGLTGVLPRCAVLVGGRRVDDASPVGDDDLVDVLPPFAGG